MNERSYLYSLNVYALDGKPRFDLIILAHQIPLNPPTILSWLRSHKTRCFSYGMIMLLFLFSKSLALTRLLKWGYPIPLFVIIFPEYHSRTPSPMYAYPHSELELPITQTRLCYFPPHQLLHLLVVRARTHLGEYQNIPRNDWRPFQP